jgi:hypothetical protein
MITLKSDRGLKSCLLAHALPSQSNKSLLVIELGASEAIPRWPLCGLKISCRSRSNRAEDCARAHLAIPCNQTWHFSRLVRIYYISFVVNKVLSLIRVSCRIPLPDQLMLTRRLLSTAPSPFIHQFVSSRCSINITLCCID